MTSIFCLRRIKLMEKIAKRDMEQSLRDLEHQKYEVPLLFLPPSWEDPENTPEVREDTDLVIPGDPGHRNKTQAKCLNLLT